VATGDFGPGRMPPDMFYNCNEEIKRQKEQTTKNQNVLVGKARLRDRDPTLECGPYKTESNVVSDVVRLVTTTESRA
jgi:hypothetical protein